MANLAENFHSSVKYDAEMDLLIILLTAMVIGAYSKKHGDLARLSKLQKSLKKKN